MNIDKLIAANKEIELQNAQLLDAGNEIAQLKDQIANMTLANAGVNSRLTNSVDLHNAVVVENNGLKAQVELLQKLACSLNFEANGGNGDMFYSVRDEILKNETQASN